MLASAVPAALVNGAMGHALDYDDITRPFKGHPSVVCLPPALAVGEMVGASGRDVMLAYMVAFEVGCAISTGMSVDYADDLGWHPTAPVGTLAAAAAAARLLGLNEEQTAMAISLAASNACGLRENFGTMTKPFHAGNASRGGVTAALLVQRGYKAATTGLEGRFGFMHAFSGGRGEDVKKPLEQLGKKFFLEDAGVNIKKYPCCGSNHGALDSLLAMLKQRNLGLADIERVDVDNVPAISHVLLHPNPKLGYQGKFSLHYNIATALVDRKIDIDSFTDEKLNRPEYREARAKTHVNVMSNWDPQYEHGPTYNPVTITLKNGERITQKTNRHTMHGAPADPLSEPELKDKFRDCARRVLAPDQVEGAVNAWWTLDRAPRLTEALAAVTPR